MSFFRSTRPSWLVYAIALLGLVIAAGAIKIIEFDVWWHLTTGWVIENLKEIPRNDIFSYTVFGAPWHNHEWLFELIQWLIYDNGGIVALTAMKFTLLAAMTWLIFITVSRLSSSRNAALWSSIIFIWAAAYRVMDRPFLLGMLLLALYCLVLHTYVKNGTRAIWALPFIQVLWINLHGGGLLGIEIVLAFAAGESLQAFAEKRLGGPQSIPANLRSRLWVVGLMCAAACLVNPWGFEAFVFPFEHMKMETILAYTQEWLPVLHPALDGLIPPMIVLACYAAVAISYIVNARRVRVSHLLLTALFAMLLPKGHRFGPEFMIVNLPIVFANFSQAARAAGLRAPGFVYSWVQLAAALAISASALIYGIPVTLNGEMLHYIGIGTTTVSAPAKMVDFLEYHEIHGRVFNEMSSGAYLIFRRWPGERVFIDGRTPVYGDQFYKEVVEVLRNARNFEDLDRRYRFDYLVFTTGSALREEDFQRYLWQNREWKLVYSNIDGVVYLRDEPKFRDLIRKLELKHNPIIEFFDQQRKQSNPAS